MSLVEQAGKTQVDAVVVGAGLAGLYMLHRLRMRGLRAVVIEAGMDVGGTWYWNRYPGCRCDIESLEYQYGFSAEIARGWTWSERYAAQPEILRYIRYVTDTLELRPHIRFSERVLSSAFDESNYEWLVKTNKGSQYLAKYCIMATGCLSVALLPHIDGLEDFRGEWVHTGDWPQAGVDFTGKKVAVIGTGSSGIQVIPEIARSAESVTIFQRTPSYSLPADNRPLEPVQAQRAQAQLLQNRKFARETYNGLSDENRNAKSVLEVSAQEREREFSNRWHKGGFAFFSAFDDLCKSEEANEFAAEFARARMRERVVDPNVARLVVPKNYPAGTKRPCLDTGYLETLNQPHVTLIDASAHPIQRITIDGLISGGTEYAVDQIVFATGFDAMTGALNAMHITGREGMQLREKWSAGPLTYLGLMAAGFPNLFFIAGPGSPSVLSNMCLSIEMHVEWIDDCIAYLGTRGCSGLEPTGIAESQWVSHVNELASRTLFPQAATWYLGANVPGKSRVFMPYLGGVKRYGRRLREVAARGYEGFTLTGDGTSTCSPNEAGESRTDSLRQICHE